MSSSSPKERNTCAVTKTAAIMMYPARCGHLLKAKKISKSWIPSGQNRHGKTYPYHKRKLKLVPGFYPNGWLALSLEVPKTGEAYTVLTVNLEDFPAFGIPDKAFVDINNNPEAMDFLIRYNLAEDTGYRRRSGWVEYPMVKLNLPELYRISPAYFEESGQQSIM